VHLPRRQIARPERDWPGTLDEPLETRPQRLRHHLRRPPLLEANEPSTTMKQPDPLHRSSDSPVHDELTAIALHPCDASSRRARVVVQQMVGVLDEGAEELRERGQFETGERCEDLSMRCPARIAATGDQPVHTGEPPTDRLAHGVIGSASSSAVSSCALASSRRPAAT